MAILSTPSAIRKVFYANLDLRARVGDEISAVSVGNAYLGLYRTSHGVEICWGILNENEAL